MHLNGDMLLMVSIIGLWISLECLSLLRRQLMSSLFAVGQNGTIVGVSGHSSGSPPAQPIFLYSPCFMGRYKINLFSCCKYVCVSLCPLPWIVYWRFCHILQNYMLHVSVTAGSDRMNYARLSTTWEEHRHVLVESRFLTNHQFSVMSESKCGLCACVV